MSHFLILFLNITYIVILIAIMYPDLTVAKEYTAIVLFTHQTVITLRE